MCSAVKSTIVESDGVGITAAVKSAMVRLQQPVFAAQGAMMAFDPGTTTKTLIDSHTTVLVRILRRASTARRR